MPSSTSNNSSGGNANNNSGQSNSGKNTKPMSDYEFLKPWGGMQNFMHSYGLKMWDHDDVEEAHRIIAQLRAQAGHGR